MRYIYVSSYDYVVAIGFSIVMFVWEKIPLAVTAMIVCITLVVTGVLMSKRLLPVLLIKM